MCKTEYAVIEQNISSQDIGDYKSFGIIARCGAEVQLCSDVTTDIEFANRLVNLFARNGLSIIHFKDVIMDMIG